MPEFTGATSLPWASCRSSSLTRRTGLGSLWAQRWHIAGVADSLRKEDTALAAEIDGEPPISLRLPLSRGERELLLAGGLLALTHAGGRPRVAWPTSHATAALPS